MEGLSGEVDDDVTSVASLGSDGVAPSLIISDVPPHDANAPRKTNRTPTRRDDHKEIRKMTTSLNKTFSAMKRNIYRK